MKWISEHRSGVKIGIMFALGFIIGLISRRPELGRYLVSAVLTVLLTILAWISVSAIIDCICGLVKGDFK